MNLKPTELVNYASRSQIKYMETMPNIVNFIDKGSLNDCRVIVESIKEVIFDKKSNPGQKYLALELLQTLMLLNKSDFIKTVESKLINPLAKLAEKVPSMLFEDSLDNKDNEQNSEKFLSRLLNYIYIWANEFSFSDKQVNEFAKVFYKLRETVSFPSSKPRSTSRSATIPPSPMNINKPSMNLKSIMTTLELLESMPDPHTSQVGQELIASLIESVPSIEAALQKAQSSNNISIQEKVSRILNRINKFYKNSKTNSRFSLPQPLKLSGLNEMFASDISFNSANLKHQESSSVNIKSPSFSSSSSFVDSKPGVFFPDNIDLKAENENLKKKIEEQEKTINEHEKNALQMKNQLKELEETLALYQEKLKAKEIECMYYMKKMNIGDKKKIDNDELMDNGIDFRLACCDKSQLLIENNHCFISFEGNLVENLFVMVLRILNISGFTYSNLEFDVESAFGFDISTNNVPKKSLASCEEYGQEFSIQYLCITESIPVLSVRFEINSVEFQYNFRIPVTMCRFCKEIQLGVNEILNEFELLAFDNDSASVKCEFSLKKCRKLVKLSQNVKVYSKSGLLGFNENYVLAVFGFSQRVYGLITVSQIDKIAMIEVRSESTSIRKTVLNIITNQIKVI